MGPRDPGGSGGFFNDHQRRTVEAAMARIIPTDGHPGAREAGTVDFVDRYLSGIDHVYAKPDGSGFERLVGKQADAWRQRIDAVRDTYASGIEDLDRRARDGHGVPFADLTDVQQDAVLTALERTIGDLGRRLEVANTTAAWSPVEPAMQQTSAEIGLDFFPLLALHTRQGFYSDPIYGGNRDRVGWKLIGFEGPASLADTHAGRYTTRPFFAETQIAWGEEPDRGGA